MSESPFFASLKGSAPIQIVRRIPDSGFIAQDTGLKWPEVTTQYPNDPAVLISATTIQVAALRIIIRQYQPRYNSALRGAFVHQHKNTRRRHHATDRNYLNYSFLVRELRKKLEILKHGSV